MTRQSVMFLVPIETRTTENQRSGTSRWAKAPKNKAQRAAVALVARTLELGPRGPKHVTSPALRARRIPAPWVVRLTRIHPPRHRLDDDNVQAALKAVRDAVAEDVLGLPSDGARRVTFLYAQRLGERWGVEIEIMGPCEVITTIRDLPTAEDVEALVRDVEAHARRQLLENRGVPGSVDDDVARNMAAVEGERDG